MAKGKEALEIGIVQKLLGTTSPLDENALLKLQSQTFNALKSNLLTDVLAAENLSVSLSYTIIECDCDLLPYLLNAGSLALTCSGIMQKTVLSACSVVFFNEKIAKPQS